MKRNLTLFLLFFLISNAIFSRTEKFGTWIELTISKEFLKKFEFNIIPEFRLQDNFTLDEYIFEGQLVYKPWKFLNLATAYRMNTNVKESGNVISHSFVFDATGKTGIERFNASLRFRFSNETESGEFDWETFYFRPKIKVAYDIRGLKFNPFMATEIYYSLKNNDFFKGRYDAGFSRDFGKHHELSIYYRLQDYYYFDRNSINILGINYAYKF